MTQPTRTIILDACCLLNLYATDRLREIAAALPHRLAVADYVFEEETHYIRIPDPAGGLEDRVPIDISPLVDEGLITVARLEASEEESLFVYLAASIDDGEAVTGALAIWRGYVVATDDRKARRVLSEYSPAVRMVSTLELVKSWSETASVSDSELRYTLDAIRFRASYLPSGRNPLYGWWRDIMYGG